MKEHHIITIVLIAVMIALFISIFTTPIPEMRINYAIGFIGCAGVAALAMRKA